MCTCRKIRTQPYEGLTARDRATAAAQAKDWLAVRECFDEQEASFMEVAEEAEVRIQELEKKLWLLTRERDTYKRLHGEAESALERTIGKKTEEIISQEVLRRMAEFFRKQNTTTSQTWSPTVAIDVTSPTTWTSSSGVVGCAASGDTVVVQTGPTSADYVLART